MSDPTVARASSKEIPVVPPRWGFSKGFLVGAVIEVPAVALAVWVLAQLGYGDPDVGFMHVLRLTAVFAGPAAVITAGGIGRLAAYASIHNGGGRPRAAFIAARAHALAGAGLVLIAAIPHGHLPGHRSLDWLSFPVAGIVIGAVCGCVIGVICGGAAPLGIGDVMALARKPTEALRQLLDPEDLVRLGNAVRERTSHLFNALFEPAPPRPIDKSGERPTRSTATGGAEPIDKSGDEPDKPEAAAPAAPAATTPKDLEAVPGGDPPR
jgi:hypothetical protein